MPTEPGYGKGVGLPAQKKGGRDLCICPKCGQKHIHPRGQPCTNFVCVKCGSTLAPYKD